MPQLTPDQITKLKSLGIQINEDKKNYFLHDKQATLSTSSPTPSQANNSDSINNLNLTSNIQHPKPAHPTGGSNIFPLLSISGLTLLSFSGLILFKTKSQTATSPTPSNTTLPQTSISVTPTGLPADKQVPKSIQHYLLTSQQYFTQASQNQSVDSLNQAILAATSAIKEFPNDYRGFYQRGRIYQSVLNSKPELITQVIADLSQAQKLEPTNAEITRSLASAYATKGDAQNTINYLSQTIALEPTKAQNFYDLAKIQQQVGLLSQAVETYDKLISLVADPSQKTQVETEKSSIEKLLAQNPNQQPDHPAGGSTINNLPSNSPTTDLQPTISIDSPTIQASASGGLIVAAPEELNQVKVSNLTTSNSLSGNNTLIANTKEITISNTQVTSNSQIYVSTTKGGKNQNLQVISKSVGSFIIGLDTAISEDIEFKWWIIN